MPLSYFKEHYGDIASVLGLLVTFVGFVATLKAVRKAKRAAEEAQRAAKEAVQKIKTQILSSEISACLQHVRAIDSACRAKRWAEAIEQSDEVRTLLSMIRDHEALEEFEVLSLISTIEQLGGLIIYLQKFKTSKEVRDISSQKAGQLHSMIILLAGLHGRLQFQSTGV